MKRILIITILALLASVTAKAATVTRVASGLSAAIGQAYNASDNSIYFTQWGSGLLSKLSLSSGAVTTVQSGLFRPEGVALIPEYDLAFIVTSDGKLWKASMSSPGRDERANGLGLPHAIVIDPSVYVGYVTDFSGGNLWRVDLGSGSKTAIVTGLSNPMGLLMSADFSTAFIAEPNRIISINLSDPLLPRRELATGLTNAFFMDWADNARSAIYYVERDPVNRVSRLDLAASPASITPIATVSWRPSSVVRSADPNTIYVASDKYIERVTLSSSGGPVITRLGHIPSTSIDAVTGQATTDPGYFFRVKNASFGGTIHVMLNFPGMRSAGASYYRVLVDGSTTPELESWKAYRWDGITFRLETVMPAGGLYQVPPAWEVWAIPDLGFVWNTSRLTNAPHRLRVQLFDSWGLPIGVEAEVTALIDNEAPQVAIRRIEHDTLPISECALITSGSSFLNFTFTAYDPQGHLYSYSLVDGWGRDMSTVVTAASYIGSFDWSPIWFGVNPGFAFHDLRSSSMCCAHSFTLSATGNTTDGYNYIHSRSTTVHLATYFVGFCP